ncbi:MAG TPA: hypothetical protein VGP82_24160 [Ktedonobacterales bacterium]|nr:hypothetical protein [Ktedonobacterales bacterium]
MITDEQPLPTPNDGTSPVQRAPRRRPLAIAGILVVLAVVVAGAIWGVTRGNAGSISATHGTTSATATPVPRVLYQADWSQGAGGWKLPTGARIVDGHLAIESSDALSLQIPYVLTTPNYAVEMDYLLQATMTGGRFGVTSRDTAGDELYAVRMLCSPHTRVLPGTWDPTKGACPGIALESTPGGKYPGGYWTTDYAIGTGAQTFRVETRGNTVVMCPVENGCVVPVTSPKPMSASPQLSIETRAVKLLITRLVVTTL